MHQVEHIECRLLIIVRQDQWPSSGVCSAAFFKLFGISTGPVDESRTGLSSIPQQVKHLRLARA